MKLRISFGLLVALLAMLCALLASSFAKTGQSQVTKKTGEAAQSRNLVIARIWHGRTPASKADEYYEYLKEAGIKKIQGIEGNLGVQVFRRTRNDIAEFTVISYWESTEAIRKFAGNDIEKTHHMPKDAEYLLEIEPTVQHYEVALDERKR